MKVTADLIAAFIERAIEDRYDVTNINFARATLKANELVVMTRDDDGAKQFRIRVTQMRDPEDDDEAQN